VEAARRAGRPDLLAAALFAEGDARSRQGDVAGADDRYREACAIIAPGMDFSLASPAPQTARRWLGLCRDGETAAEPPL